MVKRHDNFCTVWIIKTDITKEELKLQQTEVADAKWATPGDIRRMIKEGIFINYNYLEYLFDYITEK